METQCDAFPSVIIGSNLIQYFIPSSCLIFFFSWKTDIDRDALQFTLHYRNKYGTAVRAESFADLNADKASLTNALSPLNFNDSENDFTRVLSASMEKEIMREETHFVRSHSVRSG